MNEQGFHPGPRPEPVAPEPSKIGKVVHSKAALPTEIIAVATLIFVVVLLGSRIADLFLTVIACGISYLAGRWNR